MEADAETKVGAKPHERSEERTTYRNEYRERRWDTRLGSLQLSVPKVREGGHVPIFLERHRRSEQTLISVVQGSVRRAEHVGRPGEPALGGIGYKGEGVSETFT